MTLDNWYTSVYFTPSCKEKFITIIINSCFEFQTKIGENSNQKKITWKKRIKRLLILHSNFQFSSPFKIKSLALSNKERWISSTLYTLISLCIFSMFFIHFLRCWKGDFVYWSNASFVGNHFCHSHDFNGWIRGDNFIVGRN